MRSIIRSKPFRALCAALFWLAVWQLLYLAVGRDVLIASPMQVAARIVRWVTQHAYWSMIGTTIGRILIGFAAALAAGTLLAAATAISAAARVLLAPLIRVVRAVPVASFIILVLVWVPTPHVPTLIVALTVTPIVWENLTRGIAETDRNLLEMAQVYRFSAGKRLRWVYVPAVLPYFAAACSTGMGFAWKSGIAAEVIAVTRASIGGQIYNSKIYLETADLFAWTAIVLVISLLIDRLMKCALRRLTPGEDDHAES